jgi:hypothetical protein
VTHLIVPYDPVKDRNEQEDEACAKKRRYEHVDATTKHTVAKLVDAAYKHQIKVWSAEKLERMLMILLQDEKHETQGAQLADTLKKEQLQRKTAQRTSTATTTKATQPTAVFKRFQGYYLLVEDLTNVHRPALVQEWAEAKLVPKLVISNSEEWEWRSPFGPLPSRLKREGAQLVEETATPELPPEDMPVLNPFAVEKDSALASGVRNSATTATNPSTMTALTRAQSLAVPESALARLYNYKPTVAAMELLHPRVVNFTQPQETSNQLNEHGKRPHDPIVKSTESETLSLPPEREGYCENCRLRYESLEKHRICNRHRHFATTLSHWAELDAVLQELVRPVL